MASHAISAIIVVIAACKRQSLLAADLSSWAEGGVQPPASPAVLKLITQAALRRSRPALQLRAARSVPSCGVALRQTRRALPSDRDRYPVARAPGPPGEARHASTAAATSSSAHAYNTMVMATASAAPGSGIRADDHQRHRPVAIHHRVNIVKIMHAFGRAYSAIASEAR